MQTTKTPTITTDRVSLKRVVFHKSSFDGIPPYVVATSWAQADEVLATAADASSAHPVTILAVVTWEDGEQERMRLTVTGPMAMGRAIYEKWHYIAGLDGDEAAEVGVDMGDMTWAEWQLVTYDVDGVWAPVRRLTEEEYDRLIRYCEEQSTATEPHVCPHIIDKGPNGSVSPQWTPWVPSSVNPDFGWVDAIPHGNCPVSKLQDSLAEDWAESRHRIIDSLIGVVGFANSFCFYFGHNPALVISALRAKRGAYFAKEGE